MACSSAVIWQSILELKAARPYGTARLFSLDRVISEHCNSGKVRVVQVPKNLFPLLPRQAYGHYVC